MIRGWEGVGVLGWGWTWARTTEVRLPMRRLSLARSSTFGLNSMLLPDHMASHTATSTFSSLSTFLSLPSASSAALPTSSPFINGQVYPLTLPSLLSFKVTQSSPLTQLSVIWLISGMQRRAFVFSSSSLGGRSLELVHSGEDIEEAWLTSPRTHLNNHGPSDGLFSIQLDEWCPGLHAFLCSADARSGFGNPRIASRHMFSW